MLTSINLKYRLGVINEIKYVRTKHLNEVEFTIIII